MFEITAMTITVNRGWTCETVIESKQELSNDDYQNIQSRLEEMLNDGLADKIVEYCKKKYNSSYLPKKDRFILEIKNNKDIAYSSRLNVK